MVRESFVKLFVRAAGLGFKNIWRGRVVQLLVYIVAIVKYKRVFRNFLFYDFLLSMSETRTLRFETRKGKAL